MDIEERQQQWVAYQFPSISNYALLIQSKSGEN